MRKILFLTSRNVMTSSGELRLIKNRAEFLHSSGVRTDFIALQRRRKNKRHEEIHAGGTMKVYYIDKNPIRCISNAIKMVLAIRKQLRCNEYEIVVLSGPAMPLLCKMIRKKSKSKILIDIHGACEDALLLSKGNGLLKKVKSRFIFIVDHISLKNGLKKADGAFVVTKYLRDYITDRYVLNNNFRFFVVPCGVAFDYRINEKNYLKNRVKYRQKYNIKDDEIVFLYSGGTSTWQCLKETVRLYDAISKAMPGRTRCLFFSHNENEIKKYTGELGKDVLVDVYDVAELRAALCAGDYGFLLRQKSIVNEVAFPNKYLEYVSSGLQIITTCYVKEIAKQVKRYNLGFALNSLDNEKALDEIRRKGVSHSKIDFKTIEVVLGINSFENTLSPFIDYINENGGNR